MKKVVPSTPATTLARHASCAAAREWLHRPSEEKQSPSSPTRQQATRMARRNSTYMGDRSDGRT